jgi:hypothetical protein
VGVGAIHQWDLSYADVRGYRFFLHNQLNDVAVSPTAMVVK